jgi:hypothetical protein
MTALSSTTRRSMHEPGTTQTSSVDRLLDRDFAIASALDRDGVAPWSPRTPSPRQGVSSASRDDDEARPRAPARLRLAAFCVGLVALAAIAAALAPG